MALLESFETNFSSTQEGKMDGQQSHLVTIRSSWPSVATSPESDSPDYHMVFADVSIEVQAVAAENGTCQSEREGLEELVDTIQSKFPLVPGANWAGRVLIAHPRRPGFIVRGQCFRERFIQCSDFGLFCDRTVFGQELSVPSDNTFREVVDRCLFMFVRSEEDSGLIDEATLVEEIKARVNFDWLARSQPGPKTVAVIDGHLNLESYKPFRDSAIAFGIKFVVFDRPGHWISSPDMQHLHDGFVPIDMTPDKDFYSRIVTAIREYGPVDGIVAIASYCLPPVAKAASILGLPGMPSDAVALSVDKYETRVLDGDAGPVALVQDVADLQRRIAENKLVPQYPMIVKPVTGTGSAHVYRANTEAQMLEATKKACVSGKKIIVEAYICGPELDVNFVLLDGEILFFEMNDDFPSPGDGQTDNGDFWETTTVQPSILPANEYAVVRSHLHRLLLKLGLTTGVYHLEGRVQNSSMSYVEIDGEIDLRTCGQTATDQQPRCFLMEVNPRPPGMPEILSTAAAYGINMYSLHVLAALGDYERLRKFAKPFKPAPNMPNNSRAWAQLVFLRADKAGVCTSDNACADLVKLLTPKEQARIEAAVCFYRRGQRIPDPKPGVVQSGAFYMLASRTSRSEMMHVAKKLRQRFSIPVASG
ncbi:hypothetical protein TI39_contig4160g00003 [Zymoseptoria brevis]|uniref:ATP-grasp domain-containing protein n=1 Tax=Zymoseptoria brevis TaxID=1047168 RepID=A0A0F4GBL4_9PEZI|nr:hypothetical protein TI39_contig4160g00003 [Zymoseptoria brevis]